MNEQVRQSLDVVRKELSALPKAVRVFLTVLKGRVQVHLQLDQFQLTMADIVQVSLCQGGAFKVQGSMQTPAICSLSQHQTVFTNKPNNHRVLGPLR